MRQEMRGQTWKDAIPQEQRVNKYKVTKIKRYTRWKKRQGKREMNNK